MSGIAGLVLAQEPNLTASALEARLRETAVPDALYQDGVNNGYRPNVTGTGLVPLLGSGIVNAAAAVNPSLDTSPTLATLRSDRVGSGCGQLGLHQGKQNTAILWWMMAVPLLIAGIRRKKYE